jgi:hypothetical protein
MNTRGMDTSQDAVGALESAASAPARSRIRGRFREPGITGGGAAGNEQLTAITGAILLVLLAVLGVTIIQIRQLIWIHLFLGLLLLGPIALKMASTGYRFARYYGRDAVYRRKGPPEIQLRLIAPMVVLTTVIVFVSGVILLFTNPSNRGQLVQIHKVSFIVWVIFTSLHVLGHLPNMPAALRAVRRTDPALPGRQTGAAGRWIAIAGAIVAGLVLAIVLIPDFAAWTASGAFPHHHG